MAIELDNRLLKMAMSEFGNEHLLTLNLRNSVAQNHWKLKQYDQAIAIYQELVEVSQSLLGADHPTNLDYRVNLAANYSDSGRTSDAEKMLEEILPLMQKCRGLTHEKTLELRKLLGIAQLKQKKFETARLTLSKVWLDCERELGADHAETLRVLSYFCESLQQAGQLNEAIPYREKMLSLKRKRADRQDPSLLANMNNLASLYWRTGDLKKSIPLFREVVDLCQKVYGMEDRRTVQAMSNLGVNLRGAKQWEESIRFLEQANALANKHSGLEWIADELIRSYVGAGKLELAEPLLLKQETALRAKLSDQEKLPAPNSLTVANRQAVLANNLVAQRRYAEAKPLLQSVIPIYEEQKPGSWQLAFANSMLAATLIDEAEKVRTGVESKNEFETLMQQAESRLLPAYEFLAESAEAEQSQFANREETRRQLQRLYEVWNKPGEAAKWQDPGDSRLCFAGLVTESGPSGVNGFHERSPRTVRVQIS